MTLTEQQALERLCNYINLNFKTQKEAASSFKVSDQFMSAVLTGKKRMTKAMMGRLNITRRMVYLEPTSRANTDAAPVQPMKQDHIADADKMVSERQPLTEPVVPWLGHKAEPVKQEPVHEALQIASVALQDIACSSQTENLYWWQLRARKAQKQIAECLTNAAPVEPVKQEPVAWMTDRGGLTDCKQTAGDWYKKFCNVTPLYTSPPTAAHKPNENCECANCLNYYTDVAQAAALAARQMRDSVFTALLAAETPYTQMTMIQKKVFGDAIAALPILGEEK